MFNNHIANPLYQQLKEMLYEKIKEGSFTPDSPIPSERELCHQYNLSRTTVRQAINEAVQEGVLVRKQGKGTYVVPRKITQGLMKITSFEKTITNQGMVPSTKVVEYKEIYPDVEIAHFLNVSINEKIVILVLLGMANQESMVYYTSYFPLAIGHYMGKKALYKEKLGQTFSTYDLYDEDCGYSATSNQQIFEASVADDSLKKQLRIKRLAPVFLVISLVRDKHDKILEYRKAFYRGDRYKFQIVREM